MEALQGNSSDNGVEAELRLRRNAYSWVEVEVGYTDGRSRAPTGSERSVRVGVEVTQQW